MVFLLEGCCGWKGEVGLGRVEGLGDGGFFF